MISPFSLNLKFPISKLLYYTLFLVLFFLCAVATITYSAVHAFSDRPINLVSSIKSIRNSFSPLLSTFILSQTIFISITLVLALVLVFSVQTLVSLGLIELKYDPNYLLFWLIFGLIVLVPILIWLQVKWSLAYVIAVVESKWGLETLRRSAKLVKGQRLVASSMVLLYGYLMGIFVVCGSAYLVVVGAAKDNQWRSLGVILQTAICSMMGSMMMNRFLVVKAVLSMHCKDLNGENLPSEIGDGSAVEYISLSLDDETSHAIV